MTTFFIGDVSKETSVYWGLMEHKLSQKCLCEEENFVYLAKLITISGKSIGRCYGTADLASNIRHGVSSLTQPNVQNNQKVEVSFPLVGDQIVADIDLL